VFSTAEARMENAKCAILRGYQNHRRCIVSCVGRGAFLESDVPCPRIRGPTTTRGRCRDDARQAEGREWARKREKTSGTRRTRLLALPSQIRQTLPVVGKIARMEESRNLGNNTIVRPHPVDAFPSGNEASRTSPLQFTGTMSRVYSWHLI